DYNDLVLINLNNENIEVQINNVLDLTLQAQIVADNIIKALNKTPTNYNFLQTTKDTLIASVFAKQTSLSVSQSALQGSKQTVSSTIINNTITLDSYDTQLFSAQIDLNNTESALASALQVTSSQIAGAQTSFAQAQNQYTQAQIQQQRLIIDSPLTGVISNINIEIGDQINIGQIIGSVAEIDNLEINVDVAPEIASYLEIGKEVKINDDLTGSIFTVSPTADPVSGKVAVKIILTGITSNLVAESFAQVEIPISLPTSQDEIFAVPLKAISLGISSAKLKIVEDNKVKTITVTTGKTIGNLIEILTGLEENMQVIIEGASFLDDGVEVNIKQ
ncbi:HlyD family efflux transporter periplasmic adaptor subunit, partial [bacterium]|nr:HlyD family efflux transporter periplasmic adaptor subunit [bacterium]